MNNPNTARRAAIYARISNDPGTANDDQPRRGGNGLGVQRQQDDCRALADQLGWEVVAVHVDNDISAYSGLHVESAPTMSEIAADHIECGLCD